MAKSFQMKSGRSAPPTAPSASTPNAMDNESGIDMNFDFMDFDYSVFEDDSNVDTLLDKACDDVMFYELKSKTVPEETET